MSMDKEIKIEGAKGISLTYHRESYTYEVQAFNKVWKQDSTFIPYVELLLNTEKIRLHLNEAKEIAMKEFNTGLGRGIRVIYSRWDHGDTVIEAKYEGLIWIDDTFGDLHLEFIALAEADTSLLQIAWPAPFEFKKNNDKSYTVVPMMQGMLIPNNWPEKVEALEPHLFYERAAYMPWWGQIEDANGYMAIVETAWDAGYLLLHPEGGPTSINAVWHSSLGKLGYSRMMRISFYENCDHNLLCKKYRNYVKQKGLLVTIDQKEIRNKNITRLIGSPVIHTGIYNHIKAESQYYDNENPENNDTFVGFMDRAQQLERLKSLGVEKAYIHLDGWGKMGYDNMHPDVLPPCEKAGGHADMKKLAHTCKDLDYLLAIHDQYRDYYEDGDTFDENNAICDIDGKIHYETIWAGGKQTALCTQLSLNYLKRNFEKLKSYEIKLDGTYLDVFAVIALDQCFHTEHMMTRKQCMEKRIECFDYLISEEMLSSSEEPVEWAVPHMDIVHHAPHAQLQLGEGYARGIPVPLFNLVYHDCLIIPWTLTKGGWGIPEGESGYLYALLNAGVPYLNIDAEKEEIEKVKSICQLHRKVAKQEMVRHEFVDSNFKKQRTCFADGTIVEINLDDDTYSIYFTKEFNDE